MTVSFTSVSVGCQQLCEHVKISTERKCKCESCISLGDSRNVSENSGTNCNSHINLEPHRRHTVGMFGDSGVFAALGNGAPNIGAWSLEYLIQKKSYYINGRLRYLTEH